jgi:hypothetical protein
VWYALHHRAGAGEHVATRLFLIPQPPSLLLHYRNNVASKAPEEPQIRPFASVDIWPAGDNADGNSAPPLRS